jgi:hypothetical protein
VSDQEEIYVKQKKGTKLKKAKEEMGLGKKLVFFSFFPQHKEREKAKARDFLLDSNRTHNALHTHGPYCYQVRCFFAPTPNTILSLNHLLLYHGFVAD